MKIEKLPSGSYRVRKTYNKKVYSITFDHKPSQKEITMAFTDKLEETSTASKGSFEQKANEYMELRSNVTSPSTIGGYKKILRQMSPEFKGLNINDIDQIYVQAEINRYAVGRAPKTVKNFYGLITAVLGFFRPKLKLVVTLPQAVKYEPHLPTEDEIQAVLKAVAGTDYSIPFQLGVLGMRRSEVCAVEIDDINGNFLTIDKAYIYDANNKPIIRPLTKSTEGKRQIYLPDSLVAEIRQKGTIFDKQPHNLVRVLHEKQVKLGIEYFRFHDLRHYYASYAHEHGMSDADIMASGGWSSDYTMTRIYRHSMDKQKKEHQKKIADRIL